MENLVDRLIEANRLLARVRLLLRDYPTFKAIDGFDYEIGELRRAIDAHFAEADKLQAIEEHLVLLDKGDDDDKR
jgi:hypothetical protein